MSNRGFPGSEFWRRNLSNADCWQSHTSKSTSGFPGSRFWRYNLSKANCGQKPMPKFTTGFTLIELIVIIGIVAVISLVILAGSDRFNNSIVLTNLSYEVALSIREAQFSGLNVTEFKSGGVSDFKRGYGINFYKTNANNSVNTTDYILFADDIVTGSIGDLIYAGDSTGGAEFVKKYSSQKGNYIDAFCGVLASTGAEDCSNVVGGPTYLNIVFVRPNPDAYFKSSSGATYKAAKIYLKSPIGNRRAVRVEATGQITVCSVVTC